MNNSLISEIPYFQDPSYHVITAVHALDSKALLMLTPSAH